MRQQRVEQQEAEAPHHVHQRAAGGAGEGLPEDALSRCLRARAAGDEDGADGGESPGRDAASAARRENKCSCIFSSARVSPGFPGKFGKSVTHFLIMENKNKRKNILEKKKIASRRRIFLCE